MKVVTIVMTKIKIENATSSRPAAQLFPGLYTNPVFLMPLAEAAMSRGMRREDTVGTCGRKQEV